MAAVSAEARVARARWIVSAPFDLGWFFGGAACSLGLLSAYFVAHVPIMPLVWIGILVFDGPHMAAAYTRTYLDTAAFSSRRTMFLVALAFGFLLGPACLALNALTGSELPFLGFLGGVTAYAYWHVVRQHWGFLALYRAKAGERAHVARDKWALYVACWAPYFVFLLSHPKARVLVHLPASRGGWESLPIALLVAAWLASLVVFFGSALRAPRPNVAKIAYFGTCVVVYGLAYFWVARFEPVYRQSTGPDQDFLLLSLVAAVFHNVQYVGLVWFHNRNRYARDRESPEKYGIARWLNGSPLRYFAGCAAFSLFVYSLFACSTGVYPGCQAFLDHRLGGGVTVNQLGLALWWGIALHHYWIDQRIWRVREDADLRRDLGLG